jgi:creatinine amidohydrolase
MVAQCAQSKGEIIVRIADMNWMQVEECLKRDDRCILPLGSTEQHAYLSLSTDSILAERVSLEAAHPLGIPVFPVLAYGITPSFGAYPGTVSLRMDTYLRVISDILDSIAAYGFRRIFIVNGHGGNSPAQTLALEWMATHPDVVVRFHNWWNAPVTWAKVQQIDISAWHASWMENFPWTRLADVVLPAEQKPVIDVEKMRMLTPQQVREYLGDGNFGGFYQRRDEEMQAVWMTAIQETRDLLEGTWGK